MGPCPRVWAPPSPSVWSAAQVTGSLHGWLPVSSQGAESVQGREGTEPGTLSWSPWEAPRGTFSSSRTLCGLTAATMTTARATPAPCPGPPNAAPPPGRAGTGAPRVEPTVLVPHRFLRRRRVWRGQDHSAQRAPSAGATAPRTSDGTRPLPAGLGVPQAEVDTVQALVSAGAIAAFVPTLRMAHSLKKQAEEPPQTGPVPRGPGSARRSQAGSGGSAGRPGPSPRGVRTWCWDRPANSVSLVKDEGSRRGC